MIKHECIFTYFSKLALGIREWQLINRDIGALTHRKVTKNNWNNLFFYEIFLKELIKRISNLCDSLTNGSTHAHESAGCVHGLFDG